MAERVLFTRSVDIIPMRKGVYKDITKDLAGFRLLVWPQVLKVEECEMEDCTDCPDKAECELYDAEKGCKKPKKTEKSNKRPQKIRRWGDDPEYDAVMRNFGATPGKEGEEIEQQLVFGWANVTIQEDGTTPFDWQGDIIDTEVLESAAYNFVLQHGMANQEHQWGTECGWLVESMMFTKEKMTALGIPEGTIPEGWFVGFYIPDPVVYQKVKSGEYNMFSIEGRARRIPLEGASNVTSYDDYQ